MDKCTILVLAVLLCSVAHVRTAIHDESSMDNNYNLCSNVEVREVASNLDFETGGGGGYQKLKRAAMWFGPRMGKRGPDSFEELGSPDDQPNNIQVLLKRELEGKLGPDSPWIVYLVTEYPNKYMTPRMGREIGEKCLELHRSRPPFAPRLGRNSLPYRL